MNIISYFLEECAYDKVGRKKIWKIMECLKVDSWRLIVVTNNRFMRDTNRLFLKAN